jgi:flagellar biosynthesis/type III secretory pathway ATPase
VLAVPQDVNKKGVWKEISDLNTVEKVVGERGREGKGLIERERKQKTDANLRAITASALEKTL